ncbi:hypothetical protein F5Y14DRAFT_455022 [Nemania sp. NC0429]|nr:hypothetical protein F5Y14DRAFT_455022 [Nemania sp. NC0429]
MVLSLVSGAHRLYKQDTDAVAAWLASTAMSLGFFAGSPSATPFTGEGSGGRLGGKAPTYIIKSRHFVLFARFIAARVTPVPVALITTIDRIIAARSGFGDRFRGIDEILGDRSDAKHRKFIKVLEKVREVLLPFVLADDARQSTAAEEEVRIRVAGLSVDETSQKSREAPVFERPVKVPGDDATYEAEAEDAFEWVMLILANVIDEMNRVRAAIRRIWSDYKAGVFDLAAAAIATDTAIGLVRNATENILPLLVSQGGLGSMLDRLHVLQCLSEGWTLESIFADAWDDPVYQTYDVGSGTYFTVYRMLEAFIDVSEPGQLPIYKEGVYGFYDPASDRSRKTGQEKFNDDRALLMPFFAELLTAIHGVRIWPAKDALFQGMEELSDTLTVPFYAVFAAQIFLDVTYELGEAIQRPFDTVVAQTAFMDNDITLHFDFHDQLQIDTWPTANVIMMIGVQYDIRNIVEDPLRALQDSVCRRAGYDLPEKESHRLLRMSPIASGLLLYHFRTRYRKMGLGVAEAWGSIQSCAHLYNALQHEKLLPHSWVDLDVLVANLGRGIFYAGGETPKTPSDYIEMFCRQMETPTAATVEEGCMNNPLASKAGPRGLEQASPVLSMFKERYVEEGYVEGSSQVDITPEHVREIIDGSSIMGHVRGRKKLQGKEKKLQQLYNEARSKAAGVDTRIPVDQLIEPLVLALDAETLEYVYPYLTMHRSCLRMLRAVRDGCEPVLRELYYSPAYMEKESQLPWVVGCIFLAAKGFVSSAPDRRLLEKAAEVMGILFRSGLSSRIQTPFMLGKGDSASSKVLSRTSSTNMASRDSQTLQLPDGRTLGFAEYGSPTGKPLFYFHGFPSSRYEAEGVHELCKRDDLRIIAPDRPGYGLSTFAPNRRITDWPGDVRALADHLGISRFAVMGCSGGGPYALACAHSLPPDMMSSVGLLASAGPWKEAGAHDAPLFSRTLAFMTYWWPASIRVLLGATVGFSKWLATTGPVTRRIEAWLEQVDRENAEKKERSRVEVANGAPAAPQPSAEAPKKSLAERREELLLHYVWEAFRQGPAGTVRDSQLLTWEGLGFPIEEVAYDKVHIWHGSQDWQSPIRMMRFLAERLPHCELHEIEGANHYAMGEQVETAVETLVPRDVDSGIKRS